MGTLEDLAAALSGGDKQIASDDPYALAGQTILPALQWKASDYSTTDNIIANFAKGLLGGGLSQFSDNYQTDKKAAYTSALMKMINGAEVDPNSADLTPSLFGRATQAANLFKLSKDLQAKDAQQKIKEAVQQSVETEKGLAPIKRGEKTGDIVSDLLKEKGMVVSDDGKPVQLYDPAAEDARKAGLITEANTAAGIKARKDAYGSVDPESPIEKKVTELRTRFENLDEVKNYKYITRLADQFQGVIKNPSAVADPVLAKMFVQFVEPGLAVNAGESAALANSSSIAESAKGVLAQALGGKSVLNDDMRKAMVEIMGNAMQAHGALYNQTLGLYGDEMKALGQPLERLTRLAGVSKKPTLDLSSLDSVMGAKDPAVPTLDTSVPGFTIDHTTKKIVMGNAPTPPQQGMGLLGGAIMR